MVSSCHCCVKQSHTACWNHWLRPFSRPVITGYCVITLPFCSHSLQGCLSAVSDSLIWLLI